jgi:ubiquinone/menaquinone biosynthesis C-methylase UbiE
MEQNYIETNKLAWNQRTDVHVISDFYEHDAFLKGKSSLKEIELPLLGDVNGKKVLHLQCHFGQDTISLERMGAEVTGIDFSEKAISFARKTNDELGRNARFICCDIYDLKNHLDEKFDLVFTSYGTIGWLPDIAKWANIVSHFLKPKGELVFVEFHPVVWMFDNDMKEVTYKYSKGESIIEEESGTYANTEANINTETITWNHGLAEVIQALLNENLSLLSFQEYDYSPYHVIPNAIEVGESRFRNESYGDKLPLVYSLKMKKQ